MNITWEELNDRQQEIFQSEITRFRDNANPAMTDEQMNDAVQGIKARVYLDSADFYDGVYHRDRERQVDSLFGKRSTVAQVEKMIAKAKKGLNKLISVEVVQSVKDLPPHPDGTKHPGNAAGYIDAGRIYLVADNIHSQAQAAETLAHEVVGHLGIDSMLSGPDWDHIMQTVNDLIATGDPTVTPIVDAMRTEYLNHKGGVRPYPQPSKPGKYWRTSHSTIPTTVWSAKSLPS